MINELTKDDIDFSKTMRFFDKYEYEIHVISGKNKGDIYPIDMTELKIGRYQDNDIIIPDIAVSRRHAKITRIGNQYIYQDQSTNGSYVNNKKIIYNEVELNDGDIIKIGNDKFQFQKSSLEKK
jgi:pSer/pThr/pTyr-binding forkhead associated (FHA) protein